MADGLQSSPDVTARQMTRRSFSVSELDAMFDAKILSRDEKIELIDGEIFKMNSQMVPHGVLKMRLAFAIASCLTADMEVQSECSLRLNETTLVDPDIAITPRLKIERRYMRPDEVLLAIEVSDASLDYDVKTKSRMYSHARIGEYWVVDINIAQTWVHRDPSNEGYRSVFNVPFVDTLAAISVAGISVVIDELLK